MGNKYPIEAAIKEEMGQDTIVQHTCAMPLTVQSSIDGKAGKKECLPGYFNCPFCVSSMMCGGAIKQTAMNAKAIKEGGAPDTDQMER